jgi:phosphoglycolate phosphatase-like HAD superfamily hydrolase
LASAFDVSPDRLVLVGDSVLDVSCGLAAGAITVAATWGFESPQRMFDSGAHVYCSSFSHLESWFFACRRYFHADTDLVYQEMEAD